MSFTSIRGLHAFPELLSCIFFFVIAEKTKSFRTKSSLLFGDAPPALANIKQNNLKFLCGFFLNNFQLKF